MQPAEVINNSLPVSLAFSKQSSHYDTDDWQNPLLRIMRSQVYGHVSRFIHKPSRILELNAGTGIDALHFVKKGHQVHATDLSEGMVEQIRKKAEHFHLQNQLTVQQLPYDRLDKLSGQKFDFIFSNFGGLNCIDDLSKVTKNLSQILNPGGYVTWVIMPPVCVWEILSLLKGNRNALRRFNKNGVFAHLEGTHFRVWYHSLRSIKKAFGGDFKLVRHEGLAPLPPAPHAANFPSNHPVLYKMLQRADSSLRNYFPFNRWADHLIISFQLVS
jgi:ubiquinone/menaquinone biosynthesis C-methylase UbiE